MMFGNSLAGEYAALESAPGFTRSDIRHIILTGIQTSWLSEERKNQLVREFCACRDWNT
jgi:adenosine deaminase